MITMKWKCFIGVCCINNRNVFVQHGQRKLFVLPDAKIDSSLRITKVNNLLKKIVV